MARIRTIKPDFWRDDALSTVSAEAALLAIGLLNHSDDEGYFQANPKLIEADVFPLRDLSSSTPVLLQELVDIGYIRLFFGSDGKSYGHVIGFTKHQVISKPTGSKIKSLDEFQEGSSSSHGALPLGKERNGRGKEQGIETTSLVDGKPTTPPDNPNKIPVCPHQKIIELYAKHLPTMPYPRVWDGARATNLTARWRWALTAKKQDGSKYATDEASGLEFFDRFFAYVAKSDFLTGRSGAWTACDLGWLVKSENFSKVLSGNYENKVAA